MPFIIFFSFQFPSFPSPLHASLNYSFHFTDTVCTSDKPGLVEQLPESHFTSSANSDSDHVAPKAKLSSSTSWCAPCGPGNYLQIDLGKSCIIYSVSILGDRRSDSLVRAFQLNYSLDFTEWREAFANEVNH